ncbi:Serine/threonine-protein phosphatase 2A activator 1 [Podosphaera aphanis]|nr:Serine/threonine-protein phosphatase 2A activator 1 [Podosphaera aphanis]
MTSTTTPAPILTRSLQVLDSPQTHVFERPTKKIHTAQDVSTFLSSQAYRDVSFFILQLNLAMCPRKSTSPERLQVWKLDEPMEVSDSVKSLQNLLRQCEAITEEAPPDTGPRRFGNTSFRKWHGILESKVRNLLRECLPQSVLESGRKADCDISVLDELIPYFLGSFGSSQRLDYGTGHELSFLAFLGGIWKLGGFSQKVLDEEAIAREIVIGLMEPYWRVIRRLILTYTLEPAGSHGVWGLDDHSFLPYIFGSSQYCPAINEHDSSMPVEGSLAGYPKPGDIAKKAVVEKERKHNMFFSAVGFTDDVKTGPFWEHSPMLFDISGVRAGWGKINKGMIKMYHAEVLAKFPVVQHFPFGSLFSWDHDPEAENFTMSTYTPSQVSCPPAGFHLENKRSDLTCPAKTIQSQTKFARATHTPLECKEKTTRFASSSTQQNFNQDSLNQK